MYIEINHIEEYDIPRDKKVHALVCRDYMSGDKREITLSLELSDDSEVFFYITESVAGDLYKKLKRLYEKGN